MLKPGVNLCSLLEANDKYGWVGADSVEVIVLQDFQWSRDMIAWNDLLLLLEGETEVASAKEPVFF